MKIRFIYKMLPAIFFKKNIEGKNFNYRATTKTLFVIVASPLWENEGIIQHELTHVKQFYRTFGLHIFLTIFSKSYQKKIEIEAYKKQMKYSPEHLYCCYVPNLMNYYKFKMTKEEAIKALT